MKKNFWLAMLMGAVLAGGAFTLYADEDQAQAGGDDKPVMGHGMDPGAEAGMMVNGRLDRMKEKLGLSDDQASKLKDLFKGQMEAGKPLRDQMKIDMDTLQQKVDTKASNGDIKGLLDKLETDHKQMQASQDKLKDELRQILTPTQQAKMVLEMRGRMNGMRERMDGMKHGWNKDGKGGDGDKGPGQDKGQPAPNGDGNI